MEEEQIEQTNSTGESRLKNPEFWKTIVLGLLFIGSLFLLLHVNRLATQLEQIQSKHARLQQRVDSLQTIVRMPLNRDFNGLLSQYDIRLLKQKGLVNPEEELIADLASRTELIPDKGVLGGTMHFYEDQIYVLSSKWVMAYYDDGHIAGQMLLEYLVEPGGEITWKVIDSYRG
ncbi:MAG: hypothetical protein MAGBODY4_00975 [Candidatus Marinimicrobia bacterium]|nr:hypothetical protein [Candidatus Neomarinimicrobiota bacterium]